MEGEDLVALVTCTPYGVNTHRLLVRGSRTEYVEEEESNETIPQKLAKTDPKKVLAAGEHRACYLDTAGLFDRPPQWKEADIRRKRGGGKKWKN